MKTILFADDGKEFGDLCRRDLEDEGYRVLIIHESEEQMMAIFRRELPDLVILGNCRPRTAILEALEDLRALQPETPVIHFTCCDELCTTCLRRRFATACVEKSKDLTLLMQAIVRSMATSRHARRFQLDLPTAPEV
jgi:DNA-binding NtrC family response regulator